jgi:hypothetical protein
MRNTVSPLYTSTASATSAIGQLMAARGLPVRTADTLLPVSGLLGTEVARLAESMGIEGEKPEARSQEPELNFLGGFALSASVPQRPDTFSFPFAAGVHEWFFEPDPSAGNGSGSFSGRPMGDMEDGDVPRVARWPTAKHWLPPLTMLAALAAGAVGRSSRRKVLWIGRRCWPTLQVMQAIFGEERGGKPEARSQKPGATLSREFNSGSWLPASGFSSFSAFPAWLSDHIFIDPATDAERLWAIEQALRCPGVAVVIANAAGILNTPAAGRRLQLAAEAGGVLGLLARPPWERGAQAAFSWAGTRWVVRPERSDTLSPRWDIECVRRKGMRPEPGTPLRWTAQWDQEVNRGTGTLHLSAVLGSRADAAPAAGERLVPQRKIA